MATNRGDIAGGAAGWARRRLFGEPSAEDGSDRRMGRRPHHRGEWRGHDAGPRAPGAALTVRPVPSTITSYSSSMVRPQWQRPLGSSSSFTAAVATAAAAAATALDQRWRRVGRRPTPPPRQRVPPLPAPCRTRQGTLPSRLASREGCQGPGHSTSAAPRATLLAESPKRLGAGRAGGRCCGPGRIHAREPCAPRPTRPAPRAPAPPPGSLGAAPRPDARRCGSRGRLPHDAKAAIVTTAS